MIKGKTKSGFNYEIEEANLNNYELMEVLYDLEENPLSLTKAVNMILGIEQKKKLIDHCRDENGIASVDRMSAEVIEIFTQGKQKNS